MEKQQVKAGIAGLLLALSINGVWADDFPVQGSDVTGHPGDRVFLNLTYNYGPSFSTIAEDLQISYAGDVLTLVPEASMIDLSGVSRTLVEHAVVLQQFATANFGSVIVNPDVQLGGGRRGYALSFSSLVGQLRSGIVHLNVAFDLSPSALPSSYTVSFANSGLADEDGNEFTYPVELQNLKVNVMAAVPEPESVALLLPGLALLAIVTRRRMRTPTRRSPSLAASG